MSNVYARYVSKRVTPQNEPIHGENQVKNRAGGYVYQVDCWTRLHRFLILGSEGGSYYAGEREMTLENVEALNECVKADPKRTVDCIVGISVAGRAPKNDPAVFALAYLVGQKTKASAYALQNLNKVCRIGTHIFQFVQTVDGMRGWGRSIRKAIAKWYDQFQPRDLGYQLVKYQQRNGWSHRDLVRLAHVGCMNAPLLRWVIGADNDKREIERYGKDKKVLRVDKYAKIKKSDGSLPEPVEAYELAKAASTAQDIVKLIMDYRLVRECIPTQFLNDPEVWEALLQSMPVGAMIRNLGKMSAIGLLKPFSRASKLVCERLGDTERIKSARVHPIAILVAQKIYAQGHGDKGNLSWIAVPQVIDALNDAFYLAFAAVEPTRKNWLLGVDVSGSMAGGSVAGTRLTPREAAAALALVTMSVEPNCYVHGFQGGTRGMVGDYGRYSRTPDPVEGFLELPLSKVTRLDQAMRATTNLPFGPTDCAVPMLYATKHKLEVDAFVVLTDNETWCGDIHASQALRKYRDKMGINAKLIVVGMIASKFSIADPHDPGMLDVVGFDTTVPQAMAEFVR